jgi:transcriptional regulator with XRE-family HTH domain
LTRLDKTGGCERIMTDLIGKRVRAWRRRRGLTQGQLAQLAGFTQPYVSQIEAGDTSMDKRETQIRFARALDITVAQLTGFETHSPSGDPARDGALMHVPPLRSVLVELDAGERRRPTRTLQSLTGEVEQITGLRNAADYAALLPRLPGLLLELAGHNGAGTPALVQTLFATRFALRTMGHQDLAWLASGIGLNAARVFDSPAWLGQAIYSRVQALPTEQAELGARMVESAADQLQPHPGREAQEMYGCLHLLAAHQYAIAQNPGRARDHLDEATSVARNLGEPLRAGHPLVAGFNGNWFSPTQCGIWRIAVAAELGDTAMAEAAAAATDLTLMPVPNRHVYFWLDLARAQAHEGGREVEAMTALAKAEQAAPQHFRFNTAAHSLVTALIRRSMRRAVPADMTTLAKKLGIFPL